MKTITKVGVSLLVLIAMSIPVFAGSQPETTAEEPVSVTLGTYHTGSDSLVYDETAVGKVILEELNVKVEVIGKPSETYQALLSDLAADTLPDAMVFWARGDEFDTMVKAATEGMLAPLSDAIDAHGPLISYGFNQQKLAAEINELFLRPEFNGEIYIVPTHYSIEQPWVSGFGLYIRGDVADKLGIPTPDRSLKTTDDLYQLLKRIKDADIRDINGNPGYPIGSFNWGGIVYEVIGRQYTFGGQSMIGAENGRVKTFLELDNAWNFIVFMRKLVKEGLIDPEMFTDAFGRMTEKIAQGRFAIWPIFADIAVIPATNYIKALLSAAPEMAYRPLGNTDTYRGNNEAIITDNVSRGLSFAVSSNADVNATIKLINWLNTRDGRASVLYGKKDEQWFWNDEGFAEMYPEFYNQAKADRKTFAETYGANAPGSVLRLLSEVTGIDDPKYDVTGSGSDDIIFYQNAPDVLDAINAARAAVYDSIEVVRIKNLAELLTTYPDRDQFEPAWNQRNDILFQCILVDTEDEARDILERYRDTLKKNGYDDFIAYMQKEYDANPGKYADYLNQ